MNDRKPITLSSHEAYYLATVILPRFIKAQEQVVRAFEDEQAALSPSDIDRGEYADLSDHISDENNVTRMANGLRMALWDGRDDR